METKHGGSEASGLVLPIGLGALMPETSAGMVLVPQEVADARKQAAERKERAIQLERRRIALALIPALIGTPVKQLESVVCDALVLVDELMAMTGGGI